MRKRTLKFAVAKLQERCEDKDVKLEKSKSIIYEIRNELGKIKELVENQLHSKDPLILYTIEYGDEISGYQRFQCNAHGWEWNSRRVGHKMFYIWNEQGEKEKVAVFYCDAETFISHTERPVCCP